MAKNSAVLKVVIGGANLAFTAGILLAGHNLFFRGHHSWWLIAGLILLTPGIASGVRGTPRPAAPPAAAAEAVTGAFEAGHVQKLRSVVFSFPRAWKYEKPGVGNHMFLSEEFGFVIAIELTYLNQTEINTLDGYKDYAVEFVRGRKSRLLFNEIRQRWGMDVHEFGDESPNTAGHRVTIPYHGTEYGFQLRLNNPALAPAARIWFEAFLSRVRFEPPVLISQQAFDGRLSIGLPPEFQAQPTPNGGTADWKSSSRQNCTFRVLSGPGTQGQSPAALLARLAESCPRPERARKEMETMPRVSLRENGFGGYVHYQAEAAWSWFGAAGDLPTGGRYALCLDDRDPRQQPFEAVYHYVQMAYEVIVSMRENSARAAAFQPKPAGPSSPLSLDIRKARNQGLLALNLDAQGLESLPDEMETLISLRELFLRKNLLEKLPEAICQLTNLEVLHVSGNRLGSLPVGLGRLKKLRILGISTNALTELPPSIGDLSSLEELHAGGNLLKALPDSMGRLQHLVKLNVCNNRLAALPRELAACRSLKYLYLHDNPGLGLSDRDLGPTWMDVRSGESPRAPKKILESWLSRQG